MSERELENYLNRIEAGLAEAQHNMLVEKALHNRNVVVVNDKGEVVHVPAKQLLEEDAKATKM